LGYSKELSVDPRRLSSDDVSILGCGCHRLGQERRVRGDDSLDEVFGSEDDDRIGVDGTQDLSGRYIRHGGCSVVSDIRGLSAEGDLLVDLFDSIKTMARGEIRVV